MTKEVDIRKREVEDMKREREELRGQVAKARE